MVRKLVSSVVLSSFLIGMLTLSFKVSAVRASAITVPDDYGTIQEALDNACEGDVILVRNGTYYERIVSVEKSSTIIGENKINTVVDELNISSSTGVYLANFCINNLTAQNSTIWATDCLFKKLLLTSEARLFLSGSEAWEVHTIDNGEILGFYDLPVFGKVVFSLPFGFIFYVLLFLMFFAAVGVMLVFILRRKNVHQTQSPPRAHWGWAVVWAVFGVLNLLVFLAGFVSGDAVSMVGAIFVAFVYPSLYLTSVKSDHIVKRVLEVSFMLLALGVVIYGYILTGSLVLGVMTIFIVAMFFVAFILSYLLPRIRSKSSERG